MAEMQILSNMKAHIEKAANEVQAIQKDFTASVQAVNTLQSQLSENTLVKEELDHLEDGSKIFKLVGPVLIPQEIGEAKNTVNTRIGFISKELSSVRDKSQKLEKLQQEKKVALLSEQQKFQTLVQQTASRRQ